MNNLSRVVSARKECYVTIMVLACLNTGANGTVIMVGGSSDGSNPVHCPYGSRNGITDTTNTTRRSRRAMNVLQRPIRGLMVAKITIIAMIIMKMMMVKVNKKKMIMMMN